MESVVLTGLPAFELEAEWDESCPERGLWVVPSCSVGVALRLLLLLPFLTSSSEVKSELSEGLRPAALDEGNWICRSIKRANYKRHCKVCL